MHWNILESHASIYIYMCICIYLYVCVLYSIYTYTVLLYIVMYIINIFDIYITCSILHYYIADIHSNNSNRHTN